MSAAESFPAVVQWRGDCAEGFHPFSAALVGADGALVHAVGHPHHITTWRSAAKPFQLAVCLETLGPAAASLSAEQLAVGAASHSGEPEHLTWVRSVWEQLGVREEDLLCGAHWPVHEPSAHALVRSGQPKTAIHNNCSGKHTFMVAAARALGTSGRMSVLPYLHPEHPLQQRILAGVKAWAGTTEVRTVTDGCSAPCFVLPLSGMARAWAQLAEQTSAEATTPLGRAAQAMRQAPWAVSGTGRLDLELSELATEPIMTKVGAAGLICGAIVQRGLGFALKIHSGVDAARPAAVRALLERWCPGLLPEGSLERSLKVRNVVGNTVGRWEVEWR